MSKTRILGAVLAGGLSTRFGSDKAEALLDGERLIDHAFAALSAQCDAVIVVGRQDGRHGGIPDWPGASLGPLGGIAAALRHAEATGFAAVLTCGVDSVGLPLNLLGQLLPAPACLRSQPVIGLWPVEAASAVEAILTGDGKHSVMRFAEAIDARTVALAEAPANVNRPQDLDTLRGHDA